MSAFTDWLPLDLRLVSSTGPWFARRHRWVVLSPIRWEVGALGSGDVVVVPAGFDTDLTSTPRWSWSVFPPWGEYAQAAVLHDWLYGPGRRSRVFADRQFRDAMRALGVAWPTRWIMWSAVRCFGWWRWRRSSA